MFYTIAFMTQCSAKRLPSAAHGCHFDPSRVYLKMGTQLMFKTVAFMAQCSAKRLLSNAAHGRHFDSSTGYIIIYVVLSLLKVKISAPIEARVHPASSR